MNPAHDPTDVLLLGCNGNAWDAIEIIRALNRQQPRYRILGYLDDDPGKQGTTFLGHEVLGPFSRLSSYPTAGLVYCIGSPHSFRKRADLLHAFSIPPERFLTLVHPSTVISEECVLGPGTVVSSHCYLGPFSRIGSFAVILSHCVVSHETMIGDHSILSSGVKLAGRIEVGSSCYIGAGALVRNDLTIGERSLIGMGSVVVRNVAAGSTVAGNPARELPEKREKP